MTRVHIRTDDDVYRVDAVWLGPPRATFPWRARYSAYGVGLLVMIVIMFVQRRLGIDIGFFSVAWSLLITVVATRFVSRRINDERPLLEWLTLFSHELRGPRPRTRTLGGALATGHVAVRRDPYRRAPLSRAAWAPAGTVALPRAARDEHPAHALVPALATPADADPRATHRSPVRDAHGFGPPSSAEIGTPETAARDRGAVRDDVPAPTGPRALPPATGGATASAAAIVASWGGPERAEPVRVTARRVDRGARGAGAPPETGRPAARPTRAGRPVGGERAPGRGPRAFGPGAGRGSGSGTGQEDDGATPFDRR